MADSGNIIIKGAKVNNLKNVSVEIPRNKLVVVTGISGSGKSSLAFDTLFAEGQRRFAESLSSYARQFLGRMSKPDVESIEGIPPAIAIEQKVNTKNPRSTVATTTEIYDYLRIIFARIGRTFSPVSGVEVKCHSGNDVMEFVLGSKIPTSVYLLADLGWDRRSDKVELLLSLKEEGYSRLWSEAGGVTRIDDVLQASSSGEFRPGLMLMVDRMKIPSMRDGLPVMPDGSPMPQPDWEDMQARLHASIASCFNKGNGSMSVWRESVSESGEKNTCIKSFVNRFEADGMTFREPDEYMFSFNSPLGACPVCGGLGKIIGVSEDLVVPDKTLSIYDGAIACWKGEKMGWFKDHLISVADKYGIPIFEPYCNLSEKVKNLIWEGKKAETEEESLIGINEFFKWVEANRYKIQYKYLLSRYSGRTVCHECHGSRLRKDALYVKVGGKDIYELLCMNAGELLSFFRDIKLTEYEHSIADKAIAEIMSRLQYISDVGLAYLTLNRACNTLSGGESQRINLVTALGSSLVGSMYILDEPSIGLHPRDTDRLISVLRRLRDVGNTVVVVEHDEEIIKAADMLIDMGPLAGVNGGEVVFQGKGGPLRISSYTFRYVTALDFFGAQPEPEAKSIARKLQPLVDVGLSYIKLGQSSSTLSGGESQRIKLAYFLSMNSSLDRPESKKIMFVFDEPTTGLHFYDVERLLKAFDALLEKGHTVVVVEHNMDVIRAADWVIELGPDAGEAGGRLVFEGTPEQLAAEGKTYTAKYFRLARNS